MAENIFQCCTACRGSMRYGTNAGEMSTVLELQKLLDANTRMDTFGTLVYHIGD